MPLLSFLDESHGNICDIKMFCLVNVFLFQFKVHRCSAFFFSSLSPKHRRALNFRLDFLIKKGKVGVWFIIYLMQNVYKFILLFPKTTLFLTMLLVCGRCHLYLRTDVCMCWITCHM